MGIWRKGEMCREEREEISKEARDGECDGIKSGVRVCELVSWVRQ